MEKIKNKRKKLLALIVTLVLSASLIVSFLVVYADDGNYEYKVAETSYEQYEYEVDEIYYNEYDVEQGELDFEAGYVSIYEDEYAGNDIFEQAEYADFVEVVDMNGVKHSLPRVATESIMMSSGNYLPGVSVEDFFLGVNLEVNIFEVEYSDIIKISVSFYFDMDFEDLELEVSKIRFHANGFIEELDVDFCFEFLLESIRDEMLDHFVSFQRRRWGGADPLCPVNFREVREVFTGSIHLGSCLDNCWQSWLHFDVTCIGPCQSVRQDINIYTRPHNFVRLTALGIWPMQYVCDGCGWNIVHSR